MLEHSVHGQTEVERAERALQRFRGNAWQRPRRRGRTRGCGHRFARRREERQPGSRALDPVAALMDEAVVEAAERDEVGQRRRSAVGPVLDVMRVGAAGPAATWELTTAV